MRMSRAFLGLALALAALAVLAASTADAKPKGGDPAENAVQARESLWIVGTAFCSEWTPLFDVPAGERLVVQWISAESRILNGTADPVDVDVRTWDGTDWVVHPLVRLDDSVIKAGSLFGTQRWTSPVRLYSEGGAYFEGRMCPDAELTDAIVGNLSFSGYLLELP